MTLAEIANNLSSLLERYELTDMLDAEIVKYYGEEGLIRLDARCRVMTDHYFAIEQKVTDRLIDAAKQDAASDSDNAQALLSMFGARDLRRMPDIREQLTGDRTILDSVVAAIGSWRKSHYMALVYGNNNAR